jgi:hypothetical protein
MIAQRLIDLEEVLPGVDLSRLTARYPAILLEHSIDGIRDKLQALRCSAPAVSPLCNHGTDDWWWVQVAQLGPSAQQLMDVQVRSSCQVCGGRPVSCAATGRRCRRACGWSGWWRRSRCCWMSRSAGCCRRSGACCRPRTPPRCLMSSAVTPAQQQIPRVDSSVCIWRGV